MSAYLPGQCLGSLHSGLGLGFRNDEVSHVVC